jgi:hypothetical protein
MKLGGGQCDKGHTSVCGDLRGQSFNYICSATYENIKAYIGIVIFPSRLSPVSHFSRAISDRVARALVGIQATLPTCCMSMSKFFF